jgi:hypothetical protein
LPILSRLCRFRARLLRRLPAVANLGVALLPHLAHLSIAIRSHTIRKRLAIEHRRAHRRRGLADRPIYTRRTIRAHFAIRTFAIRALSTHAVLLIGKSRAFPTAIIALGCTRHGLAILDRATRKVRCRSGRLPIHDDLAIRDSGRRHAHVGTYRPAQATLTSGDDAWRYRNLGSDRQVPVIHRNTSLAHATRVREILLRRRRHGARDTVRECRT